MHHVTLSQQADEDGLSLEEMFAECAKLGVPVVHGRLDRVLLQQARERESQSAAPDES